MNSTIRTYTFLVFLLLQIPLARGQAEVTSRGQADTTLPHHRTLALIRALTAAVQQGDYPDFYPEGITVETEKDYEKVYVRAMQYVEGYEILSTRFEGSDRFEIELLVRLREEAQPSPPADRALSELVRAKQSPTIVIDVQERYDTEGLSGSPVSEWLRNRAVALGLEVVSRERSEAAAARAAAREEVAGDDETARQYRSQLQQVGDFRIGGRIICRYVGPVETFGLMQNRYNIQGHLELTRVGDDQLLLHTDLPPIEILSSLQDRSIGAADAVRKALEDDKIQRRLGPEFFGKLFSLWLTELDMGETVQLELHDLNQSAYRSLMEELKSLPPVTQVVSREFNARGITRLDVEFRGSTSELGMLVADKLGGGWELVRETRGTLDFRPASVTPVLPDAGAPDPSHAPAPAGPVSREWIVGLVVVGLICLGGAGWFLRSK